MNKNYLLIDSKYRDQSSYNTSKFTYKLPKPIRVHSYLKINYLYMPRCNYLINSTNNLFSIYFIDLTTNIDIVLPQQNFTPITLCSYINIYMNKYNGFNCSYNEFTYKFDFTADSDFKIDLTNSNFYKLISLDKKIYESNNNKFTSGIINFNNPSYINLNISNISNDVMLGNNNYNSFNFIIPCAGITNFGDIIQYNDINYNIKMRVNDLLLYYLDILITDDMNELYDNNNRDLFFILEFDSI